MNVVFSAGAQSDLRGIALYIAEDNYPRAITFVAELRQACSDLAEFPRRFPRVDWDSAPEIRQRVYRGYLIAYEIVADTVTILAITHGAMQSSERYR